MRLTLGAGVGFVPRYPGAEDYRLRGLPMIGVSYGRFFAGGEAGGEGAGIGFNLLRDPNWRLGIALDLGFDRARRESDHPSLQGLGDIDRATRAVLFGGYTWRWLSAHAPRSRATSNGKAQGTPRLFRPPGALPRDASAYLERRSRHHVGERRLHDDLLRRDPRAKPQRSALPAYEAHGRRARGAVRPRRGLSASIVPGT